MAEVDPEKFAELYNDPTLRTVDICRMLGINSGRVTVLRRRFGLPLRPMNRRVVYVDPTPEEIVERAAVVRAKRTEAEKAREARVGRVRWRLPVYSFDGRDNTFAASSR